MRAQSTLDGACVIIAAYNGRPYLDECLRPAGELIVVDNASTKGGADFGQTACSLWSLLCCPQKRGRW